MHVHVHVHVHVHMTCACDMCVCMACACACARAPPRRLAFLTRLLMHHLLTCHRSRILPSYPSLPHPPSIAPLSISAQERTRDLTAVFNSYAPFAHLVGTEQRVLATDLAKDQKHLVAHTKSYVQVLLPLQREWLGCTLLVTITQAAKFYVRGEVVRVLVAATGGAAAADGAAAAGEVAAAAAGRVATADGADSADGANGASARSEARAASDAAVVRGVGRGEAAAECCGGGGCGGGTCQGQGSGGDADGCDDRAAVAVAVAVAATPRSPLQPPAPCCPSDQPPPAATVSELPPPPRQLLVWARRLPPHSAAVGIGVAAAVLVAACVARWARR